MKRDNLEEQCKKYLGLPPYNEWTNICYGDGIFLFGLYNVFGKDEVTRKIEELKK